jgi:regulator of replication initiation timing
MPNKRKECYAGIFNKIDHIEDKINEIKEQIVNLKQGLLGEKHKKPHTTKLETTKTPIDTKAPGDA